MDKVLSLFGLALRAGKLAAGERASEDAVRDKRARLICVAEDLAENAAQSALHMVERCNALHCVLPHTKAELGAALGRKTCGIVVVTDPGLAAAVARALNAIQPEAYGALNIQLDAREERAAKRREKKRQRDQARGGRMNG